MRLLLFLLCLYIVSLPFKSYASSGWDEYERSRMATVLRVGYGQVSFEDSELDSLYDKGEGYMVDYFYFRSRNKRFNTWNCYSLYHRIAFRRFTISDSKAQDEGLYKNNQIDLLSLDFGFRYAIGWFVLNQLIEFYIIAAPRVISSSESAEDDEGDDIGKTHYALGGIGGAGMEISLFNYSGFFIEYNYGYSPVGDDKKNIEGHQFFAGLTFRNKMYW